MPPVSTTIFASILRRAPYRARSIFEDYPGDASGEAPPVPIPNTEVKLFSAEDTRGATPWENRSSPGYSFVSPVGSAGGAVAILRLVERICPLLGLQGDHRAAIDGVDGSHRCHADHPPLSLDRQLQARVCLTAEHERCDRFLAHANRNSSRRRSSTGVVGGLVSTRLVLSPDPAWRGIAGRARRTPTGPLLAIGVAGAVLGIGGVAIVGGMINDEPGTSSVGVPAPMQASASPRASPNSDPTATERATPTAVPTSVSTPTPASSAAPRATPSPTIAPTAPPAPAQETYVVEAGDTLAEIAERFATTASALQSANDIDDANDLAIGQVLVIP